MFVVMNSYEEFYRIRGGDDPIKNPTFDWKVGQIVPHPKHGEVQITDIIEDLSSFYTAGETSVKVFADVKGENKLFRKYKGNIKMELIPKL